MNNALIRFRLFNSKQVSNLISCRRTVDQHAQYFQCKSIHLLSSEMKTRTFLPQLGVSKFTEFVAGATATNTNIPCCYCSNQKQSQSKTLKGDFNVKIVNDNITDMMNSEEATDAVKIPQSIASRYKPFEDRQRIIQDVIDEQWNPQYEEEIEKPKIVFERGKTGVFDIEELCELLEEERAIDLCVIQIPKEMDYADKMVIVTARSPKHMYSLATFVRRRFKSKNLKPGDRLPRIEGSEKSEDWIALDLGNIILHIFMQETRDLMSLEILWTVGPQYDDLTNQKDTEIVQLLNLFQ